MKKPKTIKLPFETGDEILESPGKRGFKEDEPWWFICCAYFSNSVALKAARFIAGFNGYRLVKEPKEVK